MTKKLLIMLLVLTMVLSIVMLTACFETGEEEIPAGADIVDSDVVVDVDTPSEDTTLDGSTTLWTATLAYTEAQTEYGYEGTFEEFLASLAGITAVNLSTDGDLIITLGDGTKLNVGNVVGTDGTDGSDGTDGVDGIGISSTVINEDGELVITYTDGTVVNAGVVVGTDGSDGTDGTDGQDGTDGADGSDGTDGTNGSDGQDGQNGSDGSDGVDGIGISSMVINDDGDLIITFSNGTVVNAGSVYATQPTEQVTVTFYSNGGTLSSDNTVTIDTGSKISQPTNPTREGYTFDGWYCGDTLWVFVGYTATEDMTLTAQWTELSTAGLEYQLNDDGMSYSVVGIGTATDTDIYIPSTYNDLPVTSIGDCAFGGGTNISSVFIPSSVTSIGVESFCQCASLEIVIFAEDSQLVSIGESAFRECMSLTSISIPEGVTSIEDDTFGVCWNLQSITLPSSLVSIGDGVFYTCIRLTSITIPSNVVSIGDYAFDTCVALVEIYNLSNLNITVGSADYGGVAYYAVIVHNDLSVDSILSTDANGYVTCTDGVSVVLVAYRGTDTSIVIPEGVTEIGIGVFNYTNITSVVISASVTDIGLVAFADCYSLLEVYNLSELDITVGSDEYGYVAYYAAVVYDDFPAESILSIDADGFVTYTDGDSIILVSYSGNGGDISIPDDVTEIKSYVFAWNESITSVVIPASVTSIGDYAFNGCSNLFIVYNLSSLDITAGSRDYGQVACDAIAVLTDLSVEAGVSTDSDGFTVYTYDDSVILISYSGDGGDISIPDDVTEIKSYVFAWNESITSVVIPASVTSIGDIAFYDCSNLFVVYNLSSLDITAGSWDYGQVACYAIAVLTDLSVDPGTLATDTDGFTTYTYGDSVILISYSGDGGDISIPDDVTEIKAQAFANNDTVTTVVIPETVTSIGYQAFYDCSNLFVVYNLSELDITLGSWDNGCVAYYAVVVLTDLSAAAGTLATDTDGFTTYTYGGSVILTAYSGNGGDITIPDGVTEIKAQAFIWKDTITSVVIPASVSSIGDDAFYDCCNLSSVTFADNSQLVSIGYYAFSSCQSLTSIVIPASVTSIGDNAFCDCNNILEVYNLSELDITVGSEDYGGVAYYAAVVFTDLSVEPGTLSADSNGFTTYTYGDNVILTSYSGNGGDISIPDDVTEIKAYVFRGNDTITSVVIPASVTDIGDESFQGCYNLTTVTFADNSQLTTIGSGAFCWCTGLTSIVIPASVTDIGDESFQGCYNLLAVYNQSNLYISAGSTSYGYVAYYADVVYPNMLEEGSYSTDSDGYTICTYGDIVILTSYSGDGGDISIPDGVTVIEQSVFAWNESITSVVIPASVTSIGDEAFYGCYNLTTVIFADDSQLVSIGYYAFNWCRRLTSIVIPASVTSIGDEAFYGCYSLLVVYNLSSLGITVCSWDNGMVAYYAAVVLYDTSIEPGTLSTDNNDFTTYTYGDNVILTSYSGNGGDISIPEGVTEIKAEVFARNETITSVVIPASVSSIGDSAFYECYNLLEVYNLSSLEITVESSNNGGVAYYAAVVHDDLSDESILSTDADGFVTYTDGDDVILISYSGNGGDIVIPDGVTAINSYVFKLNENITSVVIPATVTTIGDNAFYECYNLLEVYNLSSLEIAVGSWDNGCVAYYALVVHDNLSDESILSTDANGFVTYTDGDDVILISYSGDGGDIIIPDYITAISAQAFAENDTITTVVIPETVTSIGYQAFASCDNLVAVSLLGNTPPSNMEDTFGTTWDNNFVAFVPEDALSTYQESGVCGSNVLANTDDSYNDYNWAE